MKRPGRLATKDEKSSLGHSVDFLLVISTGTQEGEKLRGWRWRERILEVLNLKCLLDICEDDRRELAI